MGAYFLLFDKIEADEFSQSIKSSQISTTNQGVGGSNPSQVTKRNNVSVYPDIVSFFAEKVCIDGFKSAVTL